MNYHKIINMKKLLILLGFLTFYCSIFGQYTGNKLPSGLTVSTTVDSADYTIIQKNGETIVKAVRMDTLKAYFSAGIIESIEPLDSISGFTGQFLISDGSGWAAPVSAKYEGNDAYTFGTRLTGAIGDFSMVIGRGTATATRAVTIGGNSTSLGAFSTYRSTASGNNSVALCNGTSSGAYALSAGSGSISSGVSSAAFGGSCKASGDYSFSLNNGTASGDYSFSFYNGIASGDGSIAYNGDALGDYSVSLGEATCATSYQEFVIGQYTDTTSSSDRDSWVLTDRLFTVSNGTIGSESNALVMLKNGNTTANGNWTFDGNITADTVTAYVMSQSSFGEIWVADGATPQSIPNGTTYTKMTGFVRTGSYENMTPDSANDKITITETGYYLVNITMSSICGTNGVVSRTAAFLGGVEQDQIHAMQTISNTSSPNPIACSGIIKVTTVPIDLDVRRRHDNGAPVNFTVVYANLTVHKLGGL